MTREELIAIYDIIFKQKHSDSFKASEAKDFLFSGDYRFLYGSQYINTEWETDLAQYFKDNNITAESHGLNLTTEVITGALGPWTTNNK